jgi:hypothetical protein
MKDKWECALLNVSFVPAFETPTRRAYVCEDFVGNYSYVRNSKIYFYRICNITHETVNHAAAVAVVEYSPYVGGGGGYTPLPPPPPRDLRSRV